MRKVIRVLKTPVTMLVLLAILGYGAVWGYQHATSDNSRPAEVCVMQDVGKTLASDKVSVRVYNGGDKARAAKDTRYFLLTWGYHITAYKNSDRRVSVVTVIGNAADSPEVRLVAQAFKGAVTEGDGRADHIVDVIVPTKFETITPPLTKIDVNGPVCLPVINTATESAQPSDSASPSASAKPTPKKK